MSVAKKNSDHNATNSVPHLPNYECRYCGAYKCIEEKRAKISEEMPLCGEKVHMLQAVNVAALFCPLYKTCALNPATTRGGGGGGGGFSIMSIPRTSRVTQVLPSSGCTQRRK